MAPTEQSERRINEHGERLDHVDERLNIHAGRFDKLDLVISGDERLHIKGLVQAMAEMSDVLRDLIEWRREVVIYARAIKIGGRIVMVLLAMIVGGVWLPQLQLLLKLFGG